MPTVSTVDALQSDVVQTECFGAVPGVHGVVVLVKGSTSHAMASPDGIPRAYTQDMWKVELSLSINGKSDQVIYCGKKLHDVGARPGFACQQPKACLNFCTAMV